MKAYLELDEFPQNCNECELAIQNYDGAWVCPAQHNHLSIEVYSFKPDVGCPLKPVKEGEEV